MNILITSPSLDMRRNVNGISAVVSGIMEHSTHRYFHYRLGRRDDQRGGMGWVFGLLGQWLGFMPFVLRHRIALVHQNLPFDAKGILRESLVTAMARLLGVPVLLHVHGGAFLMDGCPNRCLRWLAGHMLRRSQVVVVLSEVERDALVRQFAGVNAQVLSNAVAIPPVAREPAPAGTRRRTLLFLGRLHESKGLEDLLAAVCLLYPRRPFRLVVCGAGPLQETLVEGCSAVMGADFDFRGVVAGEDKARAIADADVFVLPSRYGEGLPMALLEAMAAGLVPVVTDDASMKVVVQPNTNGLRVAKCDPSDLAAKLEALLADDSAMRRMALAAAETVRSAYSIGPYMKRLENLYDSCLPRPPAVPTA